MPEKTRFVKYCRFVTTSGAHLADSDEHRVREHGLQRDHLLATQVQAFLFPDKKGATHGVDDVVVTLRVHDSAVAQGDRLTRERLGRTLLLAVNSRSGAKDVIETYRSLTQIEDVFKNMKNVDFLRWQPAYHWTSQKLNVVYCVLALLLATLARKIAVQAGLDLSLPAMLDELSAIREVAVIYPQGALAHRKDHITLSRMSPTQRKLADILEIAQALKG